MYLRLRKRTTYTRGAAWMIDNKVDVGIYYIINPIRLGSNVISQVISDLIRNLIGQMIGRFMKLQSHCFSEPSCKAFGLVLSEIYCFLDFYYSYLPICKIH